MEIETKTAKSFNLKEILFLFSNIIVEAPVIIKNTPIYRVRHARATVNERIKSVIKFCLSIYNSIIIK